MKQVLFRTFQFCLAVLAIVASLSITPAVVAVSDKIGWLAYPTYFGAYMLLNGLVLVVLLPYRNKGDAAIPLLQRWLKVGDERFSRGIWPWLQGKGAFAVTLTASVLFGPFFATVVIRFLGLHEKVAWTYSFLVTLVAMVIWVPFYFGIYNILNSAIAFLG